MMTRLWFVLLLLASGCANVSFRSRIDVIGPLVDTHAFELRAAQMSSRDVEGMATLVGSLPPGIQFDHGKLHIEDTSRYRLIAKVSTKYEPNMLAAIGFWFYPYIEQESWRRGYCYWQVPLSWITLSLWTWTPFYAPCRAVLWDSGDRVSIRKNEIVLTLQKAAKAAGANLLIITALGNTSYVDVNFGQEVGRTAMTHGEGWAIEERKSSVPPPPHTSELSAK